MCRTSALGQVDEDDIQLLSGAIEDDFTTIGGDVEVAECEPATELGQLALAAGLSAIHNSRITE